jgi:hypothetical protein
MPAAGSLARVEQAKVVAPPQQPPPAARKPSSSKSVSEDQYFVIYVYRERLNRQPDPEHLAYWTQQLQSGAVTKQQLFEVACDLEKKSCNFK